MAARVPRGTHLIPVPALITWGTAFVQRMRAVHGCAVACSAEMLEELFSRLLSAGLVNSLGRIERDAYTHDEHMRIRKNPRDQLQSRPVTRTPSLGYFPWHLVELSVVSQATQ
ncbi:uncharacterized protein B0H64DRAFT_475643, partial [Chaetomium fimeti]